MLYKRYAASVYQTVLCVVQDRALAEDLVQEVFWRVWRRSTRFAAERGQVLLAWLRAVARNVGVDELRRLRAGPVLIRTEVGHSRMRELADDQVDVAASAIGACVLASCSYRPGSRGSYQGSYRLIFGHRRP